MKYYMFSDNEAQYMGQSRTERNKRESTGNRKNLSSSGESEDRAGH